MAQLQRVNMTKSDLNHIPPDERFFFLTAGHLTNEVNILHTLHMIGANSLDREGLAGEAANVQQFLLMKLLAARLHAANEVIGSHFYGKRLNQKYETDLSEESRDALQNCSKYFGGKDNIITNMRNKFVSHVDRSELEKMYDLLRDDFPFIQYLSREYRGHNLFLGNEIIFLNAMGGGIDTAKNRAQVLQAYHDTIITSIWLSEFFIGFIRVMISRYISELNENLIENIFVKNDLPINRYILPFFATPPELSRTQRKHRRRNGSQS